jgi:hypothetical protein
MTASKDAKLVAIAVAMGFGVLVFTLIDVFAPDTGLIETVAPAMLPMAVVMIADLIGFADSPTVGSEPEEVPE